MLVQGGLISVIDEVDEFQISQDILRGIRQSKSSGHFRLLGLDSSFYVPILY